MSASVTRNKPQVKKNGQIRIIGGRWRGRKLPVLDKNGLRPTTDRVKETLFNWLMPIIDEDTRCLDCFAGSGSLGFEALSRQVHSVIFLEKDCRVAQQLSANLSHFAVQNSQVICTDTLNWLAHSTSTPFDLVFLDPPFRKELLEKAVSLLDKNGWLASNAWIYLELERELTSFTVPDSWQLHKEKQAGQVISRLYFKSEITSR